MNLLPGVLRRSSPSGVGIRVRPLATPRVLSRNGGTFILAGDAQTIQYSRDGRNWSSRRTSPALGVGGIITVAAGRLNGLKANCVLVAQDGAGADPDVRYSIDGMVTWATATFPNVVSAAEICGGRCYNAPSVFDTSSDDLINWDNLDFTCLSVLGIDGLSQSELTYDNGGKAVLLERGAVKSRLFSTAPASSRGTGLGVHFNGLFISPKTVGANDTIKVTARWPQAEDGTTQEFVPLGAGIWIGYEGAGPALFSRRSIAAGTGVCVVVGNTGMVAYSYNGNNWFPVSLGFTVNAMTTVIFNGERFVAAGVGGSAAISDDGIHWDQINIGTANAIRFGCVADFAIPS